MPDPYAAIDAYWQTPFTVCPDAERRQLRELVRYATMAPNAHNTQAWRFQMGEREVRILPDLARTLPYSDPGDRELFISLGCALENLLLAARRVGYEPTVEIFPDDVAEECIRVRFGDAQPVVDDPRFQAIPQRQSNRRSYDGKPISTDDLTAIEAAAHADGIRAQVVTEPAMTEDIIEAVRSGFAWQSSSTEFRRELASWICFSKDESTSRRDGITARAAGRPHLPDAFGRALVVHVLPKLKVDVKEIVDKTRSASAVLALVTDDNDKRTWVRAGQSLSRAKLEATARGVVTAHLNNNWQWDATLGPAREALSLTDAHPQVVIRLGYAPRLPLSTRRPLDDVLSTIPGS